jgi:hypothetical protein
LLGAFSSLFQPITAWASITMFEFVSSSLGVYSCGDRSDASSVCRSFRIELIAWLCGNGAIISPLSQSSQKAQPRLIAFPFVRLVTRILGALTIAVVRRLRGATAQRTVCRVDPFPPSSFKAEHRDKVCHWLAR